MRMCLNKFEKENSVYFDIIHVSSWGHTDTEQSPKTVNIWFMHAGSLVH